MTLLFFYGTLRHIPLLECVLGRSTDPLQIQEAVLPGYRVLAACDGPFPVLERDETAQAHGIAVSGLSKGDMARLTYYEGGFDYDLRTLSLGSGDRAQVYVPTPGQWRTQGVWDLSAWAQDWAALSVNAAEEVMAGFGTVPSDVIVKRFPRIRARAWARVLAQRSRHGAGVLTGNVDLLERRRALTNFFAMDDLKLRHETFDGGTSDVLDRSVFIASDAAIVLPYDPVSDCVLLVEQIRMGPIGRHDPVMWQLEPVAGLVDPGEEPEAAAHREALEEAALTFSDLEAVGECYASPGCTTEFYHLFVGLCDLSDVTSRIGGEKSEGEDIRSHIMSFDALLGMAEARRTANAPLTLLTYWLAHHRARLRGTPDEG